MKKLVLVTAAAVLAAFGNPPAKAFVPIKGHGPGNIQSGCNGSGDLYFPPGDQGVYGCLKRNGSGVVCGGAGGYSKTCTVLQPDAKRRGLPSQEELATQTTKMAHTK